MGLSVNSTRLSTISDNIANSGTFGYKRSMVDFASVVTSQTPGSYDAGGVRATTFKEVDGRGSVVTSSNPTDLAILGGGLIPVTTVAARDQPAQQRPMQFVTTGSFRADNEGYLRTPSGLQLLGWKADSDGTIPTNVIRESGVSLEPVSIAGFDFTSDPTSNIDLGLNLPADQSGTVGNDFTTGIEYFDELGGSQTLTLTFASTATANQWTLTITDSASAAGNNPLSVLTLDFHGAGATAGYLDNVTTVSGDAYVPASGLVPLAVNDNGATVNLDLGQLDVIGSLTQFSSGFAPTSITKDGSPVGSLDRVEVTTEGIVQAVYDTGQRRSIYQIPVADVPNMNGLTALDNQAFGISADSGPFYLWDAGSGGTSAISGYTREQSASDVAQELTQLIETQRAYSSSAKIVQTVDEMLQETTNLKR